VLKNARGGHMDEFRTIAKLWPSGTEIDLGTDSNILGGPATFTRNAANFVTSPDGTQNFQFLFWNTGRHLTNKRRVRWNFSVLGWGTWTATRWYGTPGVNGGPPRVHADAFTIGGDQTLSATPIDGSASTFAAGAFPFNGNDHEIGTAGGAATVVAVDPLSGYEFSGWLRLFFGGDPDGEFIETDAGSGGTIGGPGFYDHVIGGSFMAAAGTSADLLAAYGYHESGIGKIRFWLDILRGSRGPIELPDRGDPGPPDLIRARILEQLLKETQPAGGGSEFQNLMDSAATMSREQLQRALQGLRTTLDMGRTALSTLEARLKQFTNR
jgi:hypothetical protein